MEHKADVAADLSKFYKVLAGHHKKAAAFHKAKAGHHDGIAKAHSTLAGFVKGKHDAMEDGDANKAYFGKVADHHEAKAAHHTSLSKAHSEHADVHTSTANALESQAPDAGKAAGAGTVAGAAPTSGSTTPTPGTEGAGNKIGGAIEKTVDALVNKALEQIDTDPTIQKTIQDAVLTRVQKALGEKVEDPPARIVPIARPGSDQIMAGVAPEFSHLVGISEEE